MESTDKTQEFLDHLNDVVRTPGMYFSPPYYDKLCSYLEGFDFAVGGELLQGFKEKLKLTNAPKNLVWSRAFFVWFFENRHMNWVDAAADPIEDDRACRALIEAVRMDYMKM